MIKKVGQSEVGSLEKLEKKFGKEPNDSDVRVDFPSGMK